MNTKTINCTHTHTHTHTSSVSTHNIHLLKYVLTHTRSCMEMDDILIFIWSSIPFRVKKGSRLHTIVVEVGGEASAQVVAHHVGGAERRGRTTELLQCSHNASAVFILRGAHHHQLVVSVPYGQAHSWHFQTLKKLTTDCSLCPLWTSTATHTFVTLRLYKTWQ